MKILCAVLLALFFLLQYELWFSSGGFFSTTKLKHAIIQQEAIEAKLQQKNQVSLLDIQALKRGESRVEEKARHELGMIKNDEVFYQIIDKRKVKKQQDDKIITVQ